MRFHAAYPPIPWIYKDGIDYQGVSWSEACWREYGCIAYGKHQTWNRTRALIRVFLWRLVLTRVEDRFFNGVDPRWYYRLTNWLY